MNQSIQQNLAQNRLAVVTQKLLGYCRDCNWAGFEPYDATNSPIFERLPFLDSRLPRLVLTQFLKRSPLNLRRILGIVPTQNPKALGLFLSAVVNLRKAGFSVDSSTTESLLEGLQVLRSPYDKYWCWGYNFPWQTRTILVPRWGPNVVCTTFVAQGLLDVFAETGNAKCLEMAVSAANYIIGDLYWNSGNGRCGFYYPITQFDNQVHNANLEAAALLCRISKLTGDAKYIEPALAAARYAVTQQFEDGRWAYGESPHQQWTDNFHTGFNLSSLRAMSSTLGTTEFDDTIERGFRFYLSHFFREDGAVGYYHDRFYPIDTHCIAQAIITLLDLKDLDAENMARVWKIFTWATDTIWNDRRGYFYYRILRTAIIRTSYIRWTQAWMLLALSRLLEESRLSQKDPSTCEAAK